MKQLNTSGKIYTQQIDYFTFRILLGFTRLYKYGNYIGIHPNRLPKIFNIYNSGKRI